MKNEKIRIAMIRRNLKQYEVAEMLGMTETGLSRRLRYELPKDEQKRIIDVINGTSKKENER